METLAYVYLAASSESLEGSQLKCFEPFNWKKLPSSAWIHLGAIAISLTMLGMSGHRALALQRGNQGSQVTTLQQKLTATGFYKGQITGFYGSTTQDAVRRFQQAQGLPMDGMAGPNTLSVLYGVSGRRNSLPITMVLRRGSRGTSVTQLQNTLKAQGFYPGPVTGYYGGLTEEAVRKFQQAQGLLVDGMAGFKTLSALGDNSDTSDIQNGTQLQRGNSGSAVTQLQNRLRAVGVYDGPITGYYGQLTEAAVRKFQLSRGLSVNGIAGPTTLGALQKVYPHRNPTAIA